MTQVYGPFISRAQAKEQGLRLYFTGRECKRGHTSVHDMEGKCRECRLARQRNHFSQNKERYSATMKKWHERNPDYQEQYNTQYRQENRERLLTNDRERYWQERDRFLSYQSSKEVKDRNNERAKERRRSDPQYKLVKSLRCRLNAALKAAGARKGSATKRLAGCGMEFLQNYLEAMFLPGMTWDNHSLHGWHIDHIRPCASFDLTDPEQQKQCFHYTNLQPLWAKDNMEKSDKWSPDSNCGTAGLVSA